MILAFNIFICLVAVIATIYLFEKDLKLSLLSFLIIVQYIWMFSSISVIETGIYINEQVRNGYFTYANVVLLLFYLSTLMALVFYKKMFGVFFKKIKPVKFKIKPLKDKNFAILLIFFILFLAYTNLLSSPIPLLSDEVNKFNFWEHAKFPFLRPMIGNVIGFIGFGAALLFFTNKRLSVFFMSFYILYLVLIGQKFSGFYIAIYGILLAGYLASNVKPKFKIKWIFNKYVIGIVVVLFAFVLNKYTDKNPFKYLGMTPIESVFYRAFGLQGHVFWGVNERYVFMNTANTWNILELWKGMHHLMFEFWPIKMKHFYETTQAGVSWTNAYPAILLRIFPLPLALIINVLLLSVVGLFQALLDKFIQQKSYVLSIVFYQLLIWVSFAYTMSFFNKLIIPFFILTLYVIFNYIKFLTRKNGKKV